MKNNAMIIGFLVVMGMVVFSQGAMIHRAMIFPWLITLVIQLFIKWVAVITMAVQDGVRGFIWLGRRMVQDQPAMPERRRWVSQVALMLMSIPLLSMLYSVKRGRYQFKIHKVEVPIDDLPEAFEGFTITQLSDIHMGSFSNPEEVQIGVDMAKQLNSDVILFTGDLVNNKADEAESWIPMFAELKAKYGKFSVLGNHDYGDYLDWESPQSKVDNLVRLQQIHQLMGFQLLDNESVVLNKNNESIHLIGVENWGEPPFPQKGDLEKATQKVQEGDVAILMSHDPTHFRKVVKDFHKTIHLTLSGHTHGMQLGIEIPGVIRWSPIQYRYPQWAGLYRSNKKYLYVNRGFGYLGFKGRLGIWPEITQITLKKTV